MASPGLDRISELVLRCIDAYESVGPSAVEALLERHPELAPEVRRRLAPLAQAGLLVGEGGDSAEPPRDTAPKRFGEFVLLEALGGGGMGLVHRARQESLGREVALKIVRPEQLLFPEARARFRREVEVVARLQHPGIVPVYAFGEESGTPYFAMELVRGATLAEVLAELRDVDPDEVVGADLLEGVRRVVAFRGGVSAQATAGRASVPDGWPEAWDDACAGLVVRIARAVAHAHGRGVLHRDLKPSNVLIDTAGTARLFDFGLSSSDWVAKLTRSGSILGSLPYMSPEQVSGRGADKRSDVYGLGLVLHELLALRAPFDAAGPLELRDAILHGRRTPLRATRSAVARDLETVCAKAVDPDPERRYGSADELAEDLERYLERRPVRAMPASLGLRVRRWMQRSPARAVATALALLLATVAPTAFAVQRGRANERLDEQVARAEAGTTQAIETLVDLTVPVGDEVLNGLPGIDSLRRELLQDARERLKRILGETEPGAEQLADRARLVRKLGLMHWRLGDPQLARSELERSRELFEELRDRPDVQGGVLELSHVWTDLGNVLAALDEPEASLAALREGVALGRAAAEEAPADPVVSRDVAVALVHLGDELVPRGDLDGARTAMREAIERLDDVLALEPTSTEARNDLAYALSALAAAELGRGDALEAQTLFARSRRLLEGLLDEDPRDPRARNGLLTLLTNSSQAVPGIPDEERVKSERDLRRALALQEELARERPLDPWPRRSRAFLLQNLAIHHQLAERVEEAAAVAAESVEWARRDGENRDLLARGLGLYADSQYLTGDFTAARTAAAEGLAAYAELLAVDPANRQAAFESGALAVRDATLRALNGETLDLEALDTLTAERMGPHPARHYLLAAFHGALARHADDPERIEAEILAGLERLRRAFEAGFRTEWIDADDPDVAILAADPRWASVVPR